MIAPKTPKVRMRHSELTAWAKAGDAAAAAAIAPIERTIRLPVMAASLARTGADAIGVACDLFGERVEFACLARIEPGDAPRDDELRQREHQAEIDDAPHLHLEEVGEVRGADRQQEVVNDSEGHQTPEEPRLPLVQRLE